MWHPTKSIKQGFLTSLNVSCFLLIPSQECCMAIPLSQIVFIEEQAAGIGKSAKIVVHLHPAPSNKEPGPFQNSKNSYIKLSFKEHGQIEWVTKDCVLPILDVLFSTFVFQPGRIRAVGIVGIERKLEEKRKETDKNISEVILTQVPAKEMVELSKSIANKIKDKQGDITEDETIRFKSYLLSMGIANPVTRETYGSGTQYHMQLAKQLAGILQAPLEERGGIMSLTEVYCLVNRARGMELLSPEDLVNACKMLEELKLPLRLRVFDSGVMVIELQSHKEEETAASALETVSEKGSLTSEEFAKLVGMSVLLAKESLRVSIVVRQSHSSEVLGEAEYLLLREPGHVALSNRTVSVDFQYLDGANGTLRNVSVLLLEANTNQTVTTKYLLTNQSQGTLEFECFYFKEAGDYWFTMTPEATDSSPPVPWWERSAFLKVEWPVFHVDLNRTSKAAEGTFQVGLFTSQPLCLFPVDKPGILVDVIFTNSLPEARMSQGQPLEIRASKRAELAQGQWVEFGCAPVGPEAYVTVVLKLLGRDSVITSTGPIDLAQKFGYALVMAPELTCESGVEPTRKPDLGDRQAGFVAGGERTEPHRARRGPSPSHRNVSRKRPSSPAPRDSYQRVSPLSPSQCRKDKCQSFPAHPEFAYYDNTSFGLTEAEQGMLDLPGYFGSNEEDETTSTLSVEKLVI
ncbi:hypothetical protein E2I00_018128 [Balaenoptera physalus]|uniref:ESCRT-II complex subunit VPS36 n=1 Tax=Balaenoptera physalus TaxID=9770 RepID=A0A643CCN9_BALPH|nr:hypothetical protein E2I00_018128 [Balaenoptera physalus]